MYRFRIKLTKTKYKRPYIATRSVAIETNAMVHNTHFNNSPNNEDNIVCAKLFST